jgi:photosystem II stability/assembly factor-like uncharacterized protein
VKKLNIFISIFLFIFITGINAQWTYTGGPAVGQIHNAMVYSNNLYAATAAGVYMSTDQGTTWSLSSLGLPGGAGNDFSLINHNNMLFVSSYGFGIYYSNNNGQSWIPCATQPSNFVRPIRSNGTNLFCGDVYSGIFMSSNNGSTWVSRNYGIPPGSLPITGIAFAGTMVFASTATAGIYASTNNGLNWTAVNNNIMQLNINFIHDDNGTLFAGSDAPTPLFRSTNYGSNWIPCNAGVSNDAIYSIQRISNTLLIGGNGNIYTSTNNGLLWTNERAGLPNSDNINSIVYDNNFIYAGTGSNGVWKRHLSELIGIQNISSVEPDKFTLSQNYPNPFNPVTKIQFAIPKSGLTSVKIYNALGQETATLVNQNLNTGTYSVDWDAGNYASGIYFYRIRSGNYSAVKSMMLIK